MYYNEENVSDKYKIVGIVLYVFLFFSLTIFVWNICQLNTLRTYQREIQYNYETMMDETATDNTRDSIEVLIEELENIRTESLNIAITLLPSIVTILGMVIIALYKEVFAVVFKNIRDSRYYTDKKEKFISVGMAVDSILIIGNFIEMLINYYQCKELLMMYGNVTSMFKDVLLTMPLF